MSVPTPPAGCTLAGSTITCQLAPLAPNASTTVTFTAVGQVLGDHTYTAHVDSNTADDNPSDNTDSTTVTVVDRIADLSVTITPSQPTVTPGTEFDAVVTVRNDGPYEADNTTLDTTFDPRLQPVSSPACAAGGSTCALGTLAAGDTISYVVTLNARHDGTPPRSYTAHMSAKVATTSAESSTANNTAAADVRVIEKAFVADVAVTIHLPKVAYVGGTVQARIVVTNLGPQTASKVRLTTNVPARLGAVAAPLCVTGTQPCAVGTLAAGASRTYTLEFTPKKLQPARNYAVFVSAHVTTTTTETVTSNNRARARQPVHQPQLQLLPPIGTPGSVTLAFGQFLPPNALVTLRWRTGITAFAGPYRVDPDGTITVPVQVLVRDELGNRRLVLAGTPGRFGKIGATMLVVLASASPPKFFGRG